MPLSPTYAMMIPCALPNSAEQPDCVLVQDTSRDGYTEVPSWILQGYTTMANEIRVSLQERGLQPPTHIFCRQA